MSHFKFYGAALILIAFGAYFVACSSFKGTSQSNSTPPSSPSPTASPLPSQPTPTPTPPAISGSATLAVGLRLLVAGYSGPAMRIQRLSDNTQTDINFVPNGSVDLAAVQSFLGSTSALGYIVKLYDQTGNGNHVTQTTAASAPTIMLSAPSSFTLGTNSFLTARSAISSTDTEAPADGPGYWNLPAGLTTSMQGTSAVLAYRPDFSGGEGFDEFNLGGTSTPSFDLIRSFEGFYGLVQSGNAWLPYGSTFYPRQQPTVVSLVTSTTAPPVLYLDGVSYVGTSNVSAATLIGGTLLGGANSSSPNTTFADFLAFEIYPSTLTSANISSLSSFLIPRTTASANIVGDGDSITEGHCAKYGRAALRYAEPNLSVASDITNIAEGGSTTSNPLNNVSSPSVAASRAALLYRAGYSKNIYYLDIGTNDIHVSGSTGAATWASVQTILTDAKSLGYKTAVATVLHESGETGPQGTEVDNFNTSLRAAAGGAQVDVVVDYAANANLQSPNFAATYSCDGTHPNDAGYAVMGGIAASAINGILQ